MDGWFQEPRALRSVAPDIGPRIFDQWLALPADYYIEISLKDINQNSWTVTERSRDFLRDYLDDPLEVRQYVSFHLLRGAVEVDLFGNNIYYAGV